MDEIARIMWEDLDDQRQAVKVRGMNKPGQKIGNDVWCHLPDERLFEACRVSMQRSHNTNCIGTTWSRAGKMAGVEELHFMICAKGVSRLFEMDWDIPRVPSVQVIVTGTRCGFRPIRGSVAIDTGSGVG